MVGQQRVGQGPGQLRKPPAALNDLSNPVWWLVMMAVVSVAISGQSVVMVAVVIAVVSVVMTVGGVVVVSDLYGVGAVSVVGQWAVLVVGVVTFVELMSYARCMIHLQPAALRTAVTYRPLQE